MIDTSNQTQKAKNEKTDISIDLTRNEPLGIAGLDVYGIVIYDRWFKMHLHEQRISELV